MALPARGESLQAHCKDAIMGRRLVIVKIQRPIPQYPNVNDKSKERCLQRRGDICNCNFKEEGHGRAA